MDVNHRKTFLLSLLLILCFVHSVIAYDIQLSSQVEVLPTTPALVQDTLEQAYKQFKGLNTGKVADYIPPLAKMDPKLFGIALLSIEGQLFSVGDADTRFSIQSIAKPFVFGLALEDNGTQDMVAKVGVEATGLPFNSIIASDVRAIRFENPLVNAGAIATASLIHGQENEHKWDRVLTLFRTYTANPVLDINTEVYEGESATNSKNQALAQLYRTYGLIYGKKDQYGIVLDQEVHDAVDRYTKAGSLSITTKELATLGATLANDGRNPVTGRRALARQHVHEVLSVMVTAGLYDSSGEWFFRVGLPGKSGVGGGILAVVPGRFAIAVFSPPLDTSGNSVRGVAVVQFLSNIWNLHMLVQRFVSP